MSKIENEILTRVKHLSGEDQSKVLDYLKGLNGPHSIKMRRRNALRQIRAALQQSA